MNLKCDPEKAVEVFTYYLWIAEDYIETREGRKATEEDLVRSWNGGAYRGWKKESTKRYWKKYLSLKQAA